MIVKLSGSVTPRRMVRGAWACAPLLLLLCLTAASPAQDRRIAPPPGVGCDLNRLTSFTGRVTSYRRTPTSVSLRVRTDEATDERFTIRFARAAGPSDNFLLLGEPFKAADWKVIERGGGRLRAGMRATVWVCEGGRTIIDWRPRGRGPAGVF